MTNRHTLEDECEGGTERPGAAGVQILLKGEKPAIRAFADFCFDVYGPCLTGTCEFSNELYQNLTEVCCSGGFCSTDYYRQCGDCNPESSGPCS